MVGIIIRLIELLIVAVPLVAVIIGGMKAVSAARGRLLDASGDTGGVAQPSGRTSGNQSAQWRAITRTVKEHDRTDIRWLDYELDVTKLLDFPLMTDMREPLTMGFHQAKLRADLLRPASAEDLLDDRDAAREYLDAVGELRDGVRRRGSRGDPPTPQRLLARRTAADRTRPESAAGGIGHRRDAAGARTRLRHRPQ